MGTELETPDYRAKFQKVAAQRLHEAADMTLHELVDEFLRLSKLVAANLVRETSGYQINFNDTAKLALRERNIINGAARGRFGLSLETYDSGEPGSDSF